MGLILGVCRMGSIARGLGRPSLDARNRSRPDHPSQSMRDGREEARNR